MSDDGVEIFLNLGMEDQSTAGHFQREPIRASNSSQDRAIDGSSSSSAARERIKRLLLLRDLDRRRLDGALDVLDQLQALIEAHRLDSGLQSGVHHGLRIRRQLLADREVHRCSHATTGKAISTSTATGRNPRA
jgi:hypothetical protein